MVLSLSNGSELRYHDDRRMGKIYLVPEDKLLEVPQFADMGPDALEVSLDEFIEPLLGILEDGLPVAHQDRVVVEFEQRSHTLPGQNEHRQVGKCLGHARRD